MSNKIITDYKAPVESEALRSMLISFMPPGRYHGFDTMVAGSTGTNPIKVKITHTIKRLLPDGTQYAAFFSPEGLLIYTTLEISSSLPSNSSGSYKCYSVYAQVSLDTSVPNNSSFSLIVNPSPFTTSDYTVVDPKSLLATPSKDVALGMIVVPHGVSSIGGCIYIPYEQQPFGYETSSSSNLAWLNRNNTFSKVNSHIPTIGTPEELISNGELIASSNFIIITSSATAFTIASISQQTSVAVEEFPIGTELKVLMLGPASGSQISSEDDLSPIFVPSGDNVKLYPGLYTFIRTAFDPTGAWFLTSAYPTEYIEKVAEKDPQWVNMNLDLTILSDIFSSGKFEYYLDAIGNTHLRGFLTVGSTGISSTSITPDIVSSTMFGSYTSSIYLLTYTDMTSPTAGQHINYIQITPSGNINLSKGGWTAGTTYYLSEIVITRL